VKNKWLLLLLFHGALFAQMEWNGLVDFMVSSGGPDSRFITNGIKNDYTDPYLSIKQFNLFIYSEIEEDFIFEARLQFDNIGTGSLEPPRVTLASVTWIPESEIVSISLGRFINPFGLYPQRQLSVDNSFITPPLAYGYFLNISDIWGFTPGLGDDMDYDRSSDDNVGMPTVYFCGYATGGYINWQMVEDVLSLDFAVTNMAISSSKNNTTLKNFGFITRLQVNPLPFWQQGLSGSYGSFFEDKPPAASYPNLGQYRQTVFGTDWVVAYSYFELSGEAIYSLWNVPWWSTSSGAFITNRDGSLKEYNLENYTYYADFRFEPPFLTGSYLAVRYEQVGFPKFDDGSGGYSKEGIWDNGVTRYSVVFGYKIRRSILFKVAYFDQVTENLEPEPQDYVLQSTLSVSF